MSRDPDRAISRYLASRFRHESRRSFLSRATRVLFALAGVELASHVTPFSPGPTAAQGAGAAEPWTWCGLHGYTCEGNCDPTKNGNNGKKPPDGPNTGSWWLACCQNPNGKWQCIHYADYCGTNGPDWGKDCKGHRPSGSLWCGFGMDRPPGGYICTDVYAVPLQSDTIDVCQQGCTGGIDEGPDGG
jgi:hypothetical protein